MSLQNIYNLIVPDEDSGQRLDVFLKKHLTQFSREQLKRHILTTGVLIDAQLIKDPNFRLKPGQKIELEIEPEDNELKPEDLPLDIVYQDQNFLVINKAAGMASHPGAGLKSGTLANALIYHFPELNKVGEPGRPGIVHRLDRDTSGLMLVAKNNEFLKFARRLFKARQITKEYKALVSGHLPEDQGVIEKPIAKDFARRRVKIDEKEGRHAKTEYKVISYHQNPKSLDAYTFIRVILHTGRTHQIRVHFASLGHPIAGDTVYGPSKGNVKKLPRQFLHAHRLAFKLADGTQIDLTQELPEDLQNFLQSLEKINFRF